MKIIKLHLSLVIFLIIFSLQFFPLSVLSETRQTKNDQNSFHWCSISFPFNDIVDQAVMFDSVNGWALSSRSHQLYYLQDGAWQIVPIPNRYRYERLFAVPPHNIWISCFDNISYRHFLRHFNGKNWHNIYTPNADPINDLDYQSL
jgi:hypothetical protein